MSTVWSKTHEKLFERCLEQNQVRTHLKIEEKVDKRLNGGNKDGFFSTERGKKGGKKTSRTHNAFSLRKNKV